MVEKKETKTVAVLSYNKETDLAPKIVAAGMGEIAEKIIEIAQENGIPFYKEPNLAKRLVELKLHDQVPEELYPIIAEILSYIYFLDSEWEKKNI